MPVIPFPEGLEGSERLPHTRRSLTNCFNNGEGQIIPRPGITLLNTTGFVARGQFVWNENLYQVVSNDLIKITDVDTGAFTINGTAVSDSAKIDSAVGFNTAVIVVPGSTIYSLDKADTLTLISGNANFVPSDSVTHINGRFVYIPSDGDPAFFSDIGAAGTVQAASFFDAEELPDKNKVCFNLNNTLYIAGTDSIELFRDTGASPNPFQRIEGARISAGYIGGLIEYNRTFFFIGRLKDEGFGIFAVGQGDAPKISNTTIDLILSEYSEAELALAVGGRLNWRGYDIATFTLRRHSFGFFNGNWFLLDTIVNSVSRPWHGGFITQFGGKYYTAFEDKIGRLDKINTDYGLSVHKVIDSGFEEEDSDFFACQSVGMDISQGFTIGTPISFGATIGTNGTFDVDLTGWNDFSNPGGSVFWDAGRGAIENITGTGRLQQDISVNVEVGKLYRIRFEGIGIVRPASQQLYLGSFAGGSDYQHAYKITNTENIVFFQSVSTVVSFSFRNFHAGSVFYVDNVFVEEVLSIEPPTVGISMSKDNVLYGPALFRELGSIGEYTQHLEWLEPGGLGMFHGFMGIRIRTTQDVDFSADKMFATFR